ncbi:activator-dependent family glycosyltransferase [Actinoplanes sp. NEAU-A12]|uniref:Activator-dependent family glycosyltransferase n=1 Tax=Actinoplanes sandaracinus TaxID=3045177 RepID=A0ABT6WZJ3_9ACTN|nr:activator-dependent family glycosyltransferase [Actinoplanes sandaracinus]MDI6105182.1 activator-dependent family glycosyltransferase [Actinoplanes sandaracinus]
MRILFTTYADRSVFLSMVPLAWALRTAGHEVRVAAKPGFADEITQAGLTAVPAGHNHGLSRLAQLFPADHGVATLPAPYDAATMDPAGPDFVSMRDGYTNVLQFWHRFDNFPMIAGLVDFARHWRPDLVIWEPSTYAGAIAARASGAAHARLLWSIDIFGVTRGRYLRLLAEQPGTERSDPLAEWLGSYAGKYGFDFSEDLVTGQFTIDQVPASLRLPSSLSHQAMRYVPYGGAAQVPDWLWATPSRPRIAITLGITAIERFARYDADLQDILDALADLDVELVATVPAAQQPHLARVPDNARLVPYVPLHVLAPTCAAVISHAGPGTLLTTALHGVPQLTLGVDFDAPELATRLAAQGAGLALDPRVTGGSEVRDAVVRLLTEVRFRQDAARLREEMLADASPNEFVTQLEDLVAHHRG